MVLVVKNPAANAEDIRDTGSMPGLGRFSEEGHSNPLRYSCLENPLDRGAWRAMTHRVASSGTQVKQLSMHARTQQLLAMQRHHKRSKSSRTQHENVCNHIAGEFTLRLHEGFLKINRKRQKTDF